MTNNNPAGVSRRDFLKTTAAAGCGALVLSQFDFARGLIARVEAGELTAAEAYDLLKAENTLYSVCLNCNTGCGIKVKIIDGVAVKIDGNPYNPFTLHPHLDMKETPEAAAKVDGGLCPKGQAGHQGAYDPYRITRVLKRAGKRGENKWQSIPFQQAVDEIVDGGRLFSSVPGEENRHVAGMKELYALKDKKVFEEMEKDLAALRKKKPEERQAAIAEFKTKHAANLEALIDPGSSRFRTEEQPVRLFLGPQEGRPVKLCRRLHRGLRHRQYPRPHDRLPGLAVLCLQGDERAVRRQYLQGRPEVLLAGRPGEQRLHPLCRRQSL